MGHPKGMPTKYEKETMHEWFMLLGHHTRTSVHTIGVAAQGWARVFPALLF